MAEEKKGKERKLIYVSGDVLEDLKRASKREGEHLNKFVEQALRVAAEFSKMGYGPKKLMQLFNALQAHRIMGAWMVPPNVFNYLMAKAYSAEREEAKAQWYESGRLYGRYLKERFDNPLEALENLLRMSTWELASIEMKSKADAVKVRCISAQLTMEGTESLAKFIEGAMNSLGFKTKSVECLKGMAILEFEGAQPHE
jgi:hypothetical protein